MILISSFITLHQKNMIEILNFNGSSNQIPKYLHLLFGEKGNFHDFNAKWVSF